MHPGSTYPGPLIDGLIEVVTRHDVKPADVEELVLECTPRLIAIASYAEPTDVFKAKLSLAYMAAITFIDRRLGLAQYAEEKLRDPNVREFMRRIRITVPDDLKQKVGPMGEGGVNWGESRITVRLKSGKLLKQDCLNAKGWPGNPATWDDLAGKYADCAEGILSSGQQRESIDMLRRLDTLGSVRELIAALHPA
jgi:2-methylcitrate dehydratase PrpD